MASTPQDPIQRLKTAAGNTGDYGTVLDDLPQEVTDWDLFCIDPTEEEDESEATTTNAKIYEEETDFVVYIATIRQDHLNNEAGSKTPREHLNDLRDNYMTQLAADAESNGETGRYEKVRRARLVKSIGSDEALLDAIVIRVHRTAEYL